MSGKILKIPILKVKNKDYPLLSAIFVRAIRQTAEPPVLSPRFVLRQANARTTKKIAFSIFRRYFLQSIMKSIYFVMFTYFRLTFLEY